MENMKFGPTKSLIVLPFLRNPKSESMYSTSNLLEPIDIEKFKNSYLSKEFIHFSNSNRKFALSFNWDDLNEILSRRRFYTDQVRVVKGGQDIDFESIFSFRTDNKNPNQKIAYLNNVGINRLMNDGCTLIVHAVEELMENIAGLVYAIESLVHEKVQANLYACFGKGQGFDVHWDNHDVFVLQVLGSKDWTVYNPTENKDCFNYLEKPIWSNVLNQGELLYMPRGYWHEAKSIGPTIHITFGFTNRRVEHYIKWVLRELSLNAIFNSDLNNYHTRELKLEVLENIKEVLTKNINESSLEKYIGITDAKSPERPYFNFPYVLDGETLPVDSIIVINSSRIQLKALQTKGDLVIFNILNRQWKFSLTTKPILERLIIKRQLRVSELVKDFADEELTQGQIIQLIKDLLKLGLVRKIK
ncbi:JmjC domain-containing protein [Maribacter flavus]|uniref:JmjC domain-containing protein n=1 Tax=Maribacter flavus TaxID=1658664 RepID=A0A5B2TMS3_9FLAO|nr:cupin domain-containing protein [Maribacter flavus]KAA2215802.1 hypothetical protein F0361_16535 [Maribacter flavus]